MKSILNLLALFVFCSICTAQVSNTGTISGVIADENGHAVPFATVTVLQSPDVITGTTTDELGKFIVTIPEIGKYTLRIDVGGYSSSEKTFELENASDHIDLGMIRMESGATELQEVSIESLRPEIRREADKLIVRVDGTAMAAGNTAFAVLSRMPGVFVDAEGNIQLNGKGGVTVMLDGKLTYLSAADLRNMLEGMAAENIKNIEIITNPSSKYDAEGTSGILNINFKKNSRQGINGSVYTGYTNNFVQFGYSYGTNVSYKSGRWNSFVNIDGSSGVGGRESTFTRVFYGTSSTIYFDQKATGNYKVEGWPGIRAGSDFTINDKHEVGFTGGYMTNYLKSDFLSDTYIGNAPNSPQQYIDADNLNTNTYSNLRGNLHYIIKPDTLGTVFSTDLDIIRIKNRGSANFYNYFTDLGTEELTQDFLYTKTPSEFTIYSGKTDYTKVLERENKIEAGIKASSVKSDSDSQFYFNNGTLEPDPLRTNHFIYTERIYAAYLTWSGRLGKKVTAKAGLRTENTESEGESVTTNEVNTRSYLDFFPSLFVQQKVSEQYDINYSYVRRLTRPNYGSLNPFRAYRDPYTWTAGNPDLRPQYSHIVSVSQSFKNTYHLTISGHYDQDVMAEIPILDVENATTVYTTGNVDDGRGIDVTALIPLKITKWWDTQNTGIASYSEFKMQSEYGNVSNEQTLLRLQSNHTLKLPWALRLEVNALLQGPAANGLYRMAAMNKVDVAVKRSFLDKKLDVVLRANDVFKGYRFYWTTNIDGNVNEFDQYMRFRYINLTLRYNFSKGQKVKSTHNKTVEELNRV